MHFKRKAKTRRTKPRDRFDGPLPIPAGAIEPGLMLELTMPEAWVRGFRGRKLSAVLKGNRLLVSAKARK